MMSGKLVGRVYTFADFSGRIGKACEIHAGGLRVPATLDSAQELPGPRQGGAFRLEFVGPHQPMLGQGIFPFHFGAEQFELFIVPIGLDQRGARYEALFF
jgi:uncharacterized protein DUF6916